MRRWTFEREARWMLGIGLPPAIGIIAALVVPLIGRACGAR